MHDKFKMPLEQADEVTALVRSQATVVAPAEVHSSACRDKDDLPILGTLIAGEAECLVTGDRDLLDLAAFDGKSILTPRSFHDSLIPKQ